MEWIALALVLLPVLGVGVIWLLARPSHDRDWAEDHAVLADAEMRGAVWHLKGLRAFDYAADGARRKAEWHDTEIDPATLRRVWFVLEPFAIHPAVAHTMLSFEFEDGRALLASVEARRKVGEIYQAIRGGLLPTFEYAVIWGTEADMYRDTVFVSQGAVYLYPLELEVEAARAVLVAMLELTRDVAGRPRWYNTFFANCANVLAHTMNRRSPGAVRLDKSWFLPGYAARFLHGQGFIGQGGDFDEVHARAAVTEIVRRLPPELDGTAFSVALREAAGLR